MDPDQLAEAKERLERDYLAGEIDADEYTRLRRQLHQRELDGASDVEPQPVPTPAPEPAVAPILPPAPMPPLAREDYSGIVPERADSVTGAPLASWGIRAVAWFVDLLVYIGMWVVVGVAEPGDALISVVVIFGPTVYQWLLIGAWGQTLGQKAVGVRVVRSEDATPVSYLRSLGRAASVWALGLLFIPLLLAYLWPLWDQRKQTLYDKMASTIVVDAGYVAPTLP